MDSVETRLGKLKPLVAALALTVVAACGTSKNQAPPPPLAAPAPEAAPSSAQAPAKTHAMRADASAEVTTKHNTAMVLSQMHQTNLREIELAKIGEEKASTDGVRSFANQLVQDHTNLDQSVVSMAMKNGSRAAINRGAHKTAQDKAREQKLKAAGGANFDKVFLQQANAEHERLIHQLQQYREDASDDELEALIDKMIPILEQHRELAQILLNKEQA
jgi:putative membrane protein